MKIMSILGSPKMEGNTAGTLAMLEGKRTALLMTCGGPVENNTELVQGVFDRVGDYTKATLVGKYFVAGATTPDEIEGKAGEVVRELAADLVG